MSDADEVLDELEPQPAHEVIPVSRRQTLRALASVGALTSVGSASGQSAGTVRADEASFANYGWEPSAEGGTLTIDGDEYTFDGSSEIGLPDGSVGGELVTPDGATASEIVDPDGSTVWTAPEAFYQIDYVSSNSPVSSGDDLDIIYQITNTGGANGDQNVDVDVTGLDPSGDGLQFVNVRLDSGGTNAFTTTFSSIEPSESGLAVVRTDDDTSSTFVEVEAGSAIPDSVVTQYRFEDEGTAGVAIDSSGNNDANITGATYTTDSVKGTHAISTDGVDGIAESQNSIDLVANGSQTAASVGGWVKAGNTTVNFAYPISWGASDSNLISVHQQDGTYFARLRVGGTDALATASTSVSTSSHIHVAAVVTQSDISVIVDGVTEDTTSHSLDITAIGSGTNAVGATPGGSFPFAGVVDDATYGNAEWSESDVQAIINA